MSFKYLAWCAITLHMSIFSAISAILIHNKTDRVNELSIL